MQFTKKKLIGPRQLCQVRSQKIPISMKLSLAIPLLFAANLQLHAFTFGQTVNLKRNNVKVSAVLKELQKQSGYNIFYNESLIAKDDRISVSFNNIPFEEALKDLLSQLQLSYVKADKNIVLNKRPDQAVRQASAMAAPQLYPVKGFVKDDQGRHLDNVTISEKGKKEKTLSREDGSFQIQVSSRDAILVFTMVGYQPLEMALAQQSTLHVTMKPAINAMEEVVVVGYGVQKKANLTGAVSQVNGEDIALRPSPNIAGTLQGLMPGLNIQLNNGDPSKTPDINVRGFNSINEGGPLVLIDGIEGNITRVNPNDIESVSVLKDAASAAIYGARGAFGVILVTTKKGKAGTVKVDYVNNFAWTTPASRTDYISDPYVYGKTVDAALYGYNGSSYTRYNPMDWEAIKMVAAGEIAPFHEKQADGTYKFFYKTNWWDYLFKKYQPSNFHNIAISGGSEKLKAYLSGRVFKRETINNINDDANMDRQNMKSNLVFTPNSWLEISNNTQFINEKDKEYGGYSNGLGGLWSTTTWYNLMPFYPNFVDGIPTDIGVGTGGQGANAGLESGKSWELRNSEEFTNTFRVLLKPLKGLQVNFDYSNRIENFSRSTRLNPFSYYSGNKLNYTTTGLNRLTEYRWKDKYNAMNLFATYEKNVAQKHQFKLLVGYNQESFDRDRIAGAMDDLLIEDLSNLALGTSMYSLSGSAENWAIQGVFGRFNYAYDNKYLLEINSRYDGSSRFPSGSRWGFFPSVSLGWQLDRERFWESIKGSIPTLKLRASYGKLGNQTVGVNTFKELMTVQQLAWLNGGSRLIGASTPAPLPNVVTWERTKSIDFGVDLGLIQNKLNVNFDWYQKDVEGMYLPGQPLPAVFGASEPRENYAALRNKGFEVGLSYQDKFDVAGSPFRFNIGVNTTNFKGIITKYNNPQGLLSSYYEGQVLGQIWGYHIEGQFQSDAEALSYQNSFQDPQLSLSKVYNDILSVSQNSEWNMLRGGDVKYVDLNGDGRIDKGDNTLANHGDIKPIGNAMPKFPFGINISASWNNFDFSAAFAGVAKQDWYPTGDLYWGSYQRPYLSFVRKDLVDNAWTPDNKGNRYPQIYRGYSSLQSGRSLYELNDYYLTNVGFLRMKNFTLGYTLPQKWTRRYKVEKLRFYFSGENLLTWNFGNLTKYIDPEQAGAMINYNSPASANDPADSSERGLLRDYPMGKTYSFGLMLTL